MQIVRTQDVTSKQADAAYFTGRVWQEPVVEAPEPARVRALRVTFEPGARTAWHTHPLGQTLHVLSGVGLIGTRDGAVEEIHAGDTVWISPNEEHWHGATLRPDDVPYGDPGSAGRARGGLARTGE